MPFGAVGRIPVPDQGYQESKHSAHVKRRTPAPAAHHPSDQERRCRSADPYADKRDAVPQGTMCVARPVSNYFIGVGKGRRLSNPNHKTRGGERRGDGKPSRSRQVRRNRRAGCESRPPNNSYGQHSSRSILVPEPPTGNLEQSVAPYEGAEKPTHGPRRESKFVLNVLARNAQIQAVHIG